MSLFLSTEINTQCEERICDKAKKVLAELSNKLAPDTIIEFISEGQFDSHQLIKTALEYTGVANVYFTTYALKEFQARQLFNYKKQGLVKSYCALLDNGIKRNDAKVLQFAKEFMNIGFADVHAKIIVVSGEFKNVCAITSANFTKNSRIEAGVISTRKPSANFYKDYIAKKVYK
jgi:hypothetical protein